ncbi:MAG TPA: M23 family metallopeptidase [Woeseiaceae bacterium]|jgi:murein DD-endopeptidase MepM/ murein hydrolase activator NlpD|nr:M23 family metallopeptidase [Woeseiaceae bacterium]
MNIVLFGKGFGKPRQFSLSGGSALGVAVLVAGSLCCAAFAGGHWYAARNGSGMSLEQAESLANELAAQRQAIAETRQQAEDTLDALAIRVGQMNARVIRLDALGRRLTEMADLDDGEFDFDSEPALGGPEEPTLADAAVPEEVLTAMTRLDRQLDSREAQLGVLESVLMNQNLVDRVYPQGRPIKSGWMSSYFGRRTDPFTGKPAYHKGVDFAGKAGAEVLAVADGIVTWSADRYGYGNMVEINHGNGYSTRYAHNSKNLVSVGDEIKKGQAVALMGQTGRATGPNLHFEVLREGRQVNPVEFIRQTSGE